MVQNQITVSLYMSYHCYLTVGFCIPWGSTVG